MIKKINRQKIPILEILDIKINQNSSKPRKTHISGNFSLNTPLIYKKNLKSMV